MIGRDFSKVGVERNIFQKIKNGTRETLVGPIKIYWLDSTNFAVVDSLKSVHFQSVYGLITTTIVANTKSALRVGNSLLEDTEEEVGGKGHDGPSSQGGHRSDRQVLIDLDIVANDVSLVPGTTTQTFSIIHLHNLDLPSTRLFHQPHSYSLTLLMYHYIPFYSTLLYSPLLYSIYHKLLPIMWLTGTTKFAIADARKFVSFIDTTNWEIQDGFGKYQNPKKKQEDLSVQVKDVMHG